MKWSLRIGRFAGIDVFVHWSFALLIGWVVWVFLSQGQSALDAFKGVLLVCTVFACIVLHEFGHALTARRFGVNTKDIILFPFGGVARLEKMPDNPLHEFIVAVAGPLVNVVIAAALAVVLIVGAGVQPLESAMTVGGPFLQQLLWINVFLALFNMLPAFPMDGGRVLRSILAMSMPAVRATQIAAAVAQVMAVLFAVLGLFFNPFLLIIALFVFLASGAESQMAVQRSVYAGLRVRDAMETKIRTLAPTDTLATATDELLDTPQHDFPVVDDGGRVVGLLTRRELIRALADVGTSARIADVMRTDCPPASPDDDLDGVVQAMQTRGCPVSPVVENGRLLGMLTFENLGEIVMVRTALERAERA